MTLASRRDAAGAGLEGGSVGPLTVLLCGASCTGKSFLAERVMATEYGAVTLVVDLVYAQAAAEAGMSDSPDPRSDGANRARRRARKRRWPNETARERFFAVFRERVKAALELARERGVTAVFEGGTLRLREEVELIQGCVREVDGEAGRVIRAFLRVPYETWLPNRIRRAARSGVEEIRVAALVPEAYARKLEDAACEPVPGIEEVTLNSYDEMRAFAEALHATPR